MRREVTGREFKELFWRYGARQKDSGFTEEFWNQFYEPEAARKYFFVEPTSWDQHRMFVGTYGNGAHEILFIERSARGSRMSGFELKILDPLVRNASLKIDAALGAEDIAARTQGLLTARDDNEAAFGRIAKRQVYKMLGSGLLACLGALAAAFGIMAATSVFAIIAGTTGDAIPLVVAGAVVFLAGATFLVVASANSNRVKRAGKPLAAKTDEAIARLRQA